LANIFVSLTQRVGLCYRPGSKTASEADQDRFVINRGFEKNLTLYPDSEWQKITKEINSLNLYNKKNREFVRYFYRGASELICDSTNRLLLPKTLTDYAELIMKLYYLPTTTE
jgi:MraZ protein